jgi:hypothetical protein
MISPFSLFAYFGPETTLPLLSLIATVTGALLVVGRASKHYVARWTRTILRKHP